MSGTAERNGADVARQQEIAGLLPVLSLLDKTAADLQERADAGREVAPGQIAAYVTEAAHARHLVNTAGVSTREITDAEQQDRSDGNPGFTARALEHATYTRHFEPRVPGKSGSDIDPDIEI